MRLVIAASLILAFSTPSWAQLEAFGPVEPRYVAILGHRADCERAHVHAHQGTPRPR